MRKKNIFTNIRRFLPFLKHQWKSAFIAGIFMLISVLLQLPMPLVTRYVIDNILPGRNFKLLNWIIIILIGLAIFKGISELVNGYFSTLFREKVLFAIKLRLFRHIQRMSLSFFKDQKSGYLASRLSNDVSHLQGLLANTIINFLRDSLTFIVGAVVILSLHWKLALASLCVLPLFIYSINFFSKRIRNKSLELQEKVAQAFDTTHEGLSAFYLAKSFQLENYFASRLIKTLREYIRTNIRVNMLASLSSYFTSFIGMIGPLVVLWYGGREVMMGHLSLGTLVAFSAFLGYLFGPAQRLMNLNTEIQRSLASLERVFELLDAVPEIETQKPRKLNICKGEIEFKNVTFSYDGFQLILKRINLYVPSGNKVALVGKSGAGKTSLVHLITRFYEPQEGNIFLDGINIREIKINELRKIIGIVPQDVFLFAGSIRENIRCGKLDASCEEIIEATKLANAYEFIERLPDGYETEVGERGAKLSGGQRQRIAIARAFLRNPKILILDEATSELDSESERLIQEALLKLMSNRTTFIIAHRLSTVLIADKLVVLKDGEILDIGTHEELYSRCSHYKELCDYQLFNPAKTNGKKICIHQNI